MFVFIIYYYVMKKEWEKYKTSKKNNQGNLLSSYKEIKKVFHITHPDDALKIFIDKRIRSSLIQDKSKVKGTRTHVSWVSANLWPYSLYGHIRFEINWSKIVKDMNFYWVEEIENYNPTAFRILLSKRIIKDKKLKPYDPKKDNGPLVLEPSGRWYFNENYNSEFMIDRDIKLNEVSQIIFQKHKKSICCKFKEKQCDWNILPQKSVSHFMAGLIQHNSQSWRKFFKLYNRDQIDSFDLADEANAEDEFINFYLFNDLKNISNQIWRYKGVNSSNAVKTSLANAILTAHSQRKKNRAKNLMSLFKSFEDFKDTVIKIERSHWD